MKTRSDFQVSKVRSFALADIKENDPEMSDVLNSASTNQTIKKQKWRRKRKNSEQVRALMKEFNKNAVWTKEYVVELSEKTGLTEAQVYKWGWDYKKKLRKLAGKENFMELVCNEILPMSELDVEMIGLQKSYKEFIVSANCIIQIQIL
jgi:formylmethanofuran dehydrogenase subunit B